VLRDAESQQFDSRQNGESEPHAREHASGLRFDDEGSDWEVFAGKLQCIEVIAIAAQDNGLVGTVRQMCIKEVCGHSHVDRLFEAGGFLSVSLKPVQPFHVSVCRYERLPSATPRLGRRWVAVETREGQMIRSYHPGEKRTKRRITQIEAAERAE